MRIQGWLHRECGATQGAWTGDRFARVKVKVAR